MTYKERMIQQLEAEGFSPRWIAYLTRGIRDEQEDAQHGRDNIRLACIMG